MDRESIFAWSTGMQWIYDNLQESGFQPRIESGFKLGRNIFGVTTGSFLHASHRC